MIGDVISATLMLTGALSCLLGALGLVRLPDLPARLQATTKPQTLGLLLILVGVAIRLDFENSTTLVLVMMFQILTAPVISQVVGRSAYRSGAIDRESLVVDELAERMDADARAGVRTGGHDGGSPDAVRADATASSGSAEPGGSPGSTGSTGSTGPAVPGEPPGVPDSEPDSEPESGSGDRRPDDDPGRTAGS